MSEAAYNLFVPLLCLSVAGIHCPSLPLSLTRTKDFVLIYALSSRAFEIPDLLA